MIAGTDANYSQAVSAACIETIIRLSLDPATNVSMIRNGDVCLALMRIIATMMATSRETETPRGLRLMSEEFAKRLRAMVTAAREAEAHLGPAFDSVMHPSDVN